MEPENLLPHSQEPVTGPYPEQDDCSHVLTPYFFTIHFNISFQSFPRLLSSRHISREIVSMHFLISSLRALYTTHPFVLLLNPSYYYLVKEI
jgi:hypothetical protein